MATLSPSLRRLARPGLLASWLTVATAIVAAAALAAPAAAQAPPVRIMPLGDSITSGITPNQSYRYPLWLDLVAGGYNVDFVGGENGVGGGLPAITGWDMDHEGHSGWTAAMLAFQAVFYAFDHNPDVVLVLAGVNDLILGNPVVNTLGEINTIIESVQFINPDATVLIGSMYVPQIVPDLFGQVTLLNIGIANLVANQNTFQSRVLSVDLVTGFDVATLTYDGIHPNSVGEQELADRWEAVLLPVLDGCLARAVNFGTGTQGTLGEPRMIVSAPPVLGSSFSLELTNSAGNVSNAVLLYAFAPLDLPGNWGGSLYVDIFDAISLPLPKAGLSIPVTLPSDPVFCGVSVYLQVLEADPSGTNGIAASSGLELVLGEL